MPTASQKLIAGISPDRCLYCSGTKIVRKGTRKKKLETIQLWYCKDCDKVFTARAVKNKTYPIPVILDGLSHYHNGYSLKDSATKLRERYGVSVTSTTLGRWLNEYEAFCPYRNLRDAGKARYPAHWAIQSTRLHHQQVYHYRTHRPKLDLALAETKNRRFWPLGKFLLDMATACPHRLFQDENRGSGLRKGFDLDGVTIRERQNLAVRIAQLAVQGARQNKQRHDTVQKFMSSNDLATVATEVPVYLMPEDVAHFRDKLGFEIPLEEGRTTTGHIDVLQIRGDGIHILDYKPDALHEKPIGQLTFYALALSRRTGLRLFDFTCAWFDDKHYFEFYPLQVVLKRNISQ